MRRLAFLLLALAPLAGCDTRPTASPTTTPPTSSVAAAAEDPEAEIRESLAKLPEADRKLAAEQKYCAVQHDSRLGSMGAPVKVMVKDRPVFLCCKGCQKAALANADKTLAAVDELKAKAARESGKP